MAKVKKKKMKTKMKMKRKVVKKQRAKRGRAKKASPIQKGYNSITPCLIVKNANKAIDFYTKVFGSKVVMRMEKPDGKIGHAELRIGDSKIMLSDECPEMNALAPKSPADLSSTLYVYIKDVDVVVARAISLGASLIRPVETMFYGDRHGTVADPFGHKWHIATHVEDVTPAKVRKRAAELYTK